MSKLSSEQALRIDLDYNHEMVVGGCSTLLSAVLGGMPSYGQTKYNLIAYNITHSTSSAIPTITVGILCILTVLSGVSGPIINGLPRFLLAGILVYSSAGLPLAVFYCRPTRAASLRHASSSISIEALHSDGRSTSSAFAS